MGSLFRIHVGNFGHIPKLYARYLNTYSTLQDLIAIHVRLFIFRQKSPLYCLISSCIFKLFNIFLFKIDFYLILTLKIGILKPCILLFDPVLLLKLKN